MHCMCVCFARARVRELRELFRCALYRVQSYVLQKIMLNQQSRAIVCDIVVCDIVVCGIVVCDIVTVIVHVKKANEPIIEALLLLIIIVNKIIVHYSKVAILFALRNNK